MGAELHGVQRTRIGAAVNQARSGRYLFTGTDDAPLITPPEPSTGVWLFCGVVLSLAVLAIGFYAGMEFSNNLHKQAAAKQMLKPRPAPTKHDPLAAYCKNPAEFPIMCRARARSDKTRM
jgi:hypothetical protein